MFDGLLSVVEAKQSEEDLTSFDEATVKQIVILPIFRGLGWNTDIYGEVQPEYSVDSGSVDYALLTGDSPKVFVEVKNGGETLEKHQKQLLSYAFDEGVKIATLTNGTTWWFYLPIQEGSWEQRKVETVELDKQDKAEITQKLIDLLSKENVISGKAIQNAQTLREKTSNLEDLAGCVESASE